MDFGWSLADVLKKSKEDHHKKEAAALDSTTDEGFESNTQSNPEDNLVDEADETNSVSLVKNKDSDSPEESVQKGNRDGDDDDHDGEEEVEDEENDSKNKEDWMEIGTWSNEMAQLESELSKDFPPNLTMVSLYKLA